MNRDFIKPIAPLLDLRITVRNHPHYVVVWQDSYMELQRFGEDGATLEVIGHYPLATSVAAIQAIIARIEEGGAWEEDGEFEPPMII